MENLIISTLATRKKTMLALFFINYAVLLIKYILTLLIIFNLQSLIFNPYAQTWQVYTTSNSGLPSNVVGEVAFDTNNIKWIATDLGLAKFDGNNWTVYDTSNSPLPHPNVITVIIDRFNMIWLGTYGGGVAKFDGINWTIYDTNNSPIRSNIVLDIAIDKNNIKWFCTSRGLAKFDDLNWTIYNTTNSGLPSNQTWCIALEDNVKWIGTFPSGIAKYDNINWTIFNSTNSGLPSNNIFGITVDYLGNKWIATRFGGIAKFNSTANQWTVYNSTNSGLTNNNTTAIVTQNHIKWIGTGGLARYNDTSWVIFDPSNSPMPSYDIIALSLDKTGRLWIGTGLGLAVYNTGIIGINNQNSNVPKSFGLKQNYPNPFNPITTIKYDIPKDAFVTLKVYDVLGREVFSVNEFKKAGSYETLFDGSGFASGVYFYSLEANGLKETKKMLMVK